MRPRIGLLDIRDVGAYPWQQRRTNGHLHALGLTSGGLDGAFRAFEPPPCLVVVADGLLTANIAAHRGWLAAAAAVIVVRDWDAAETVPDDPELRPLIDEEWRRVLAGVASLSFVERREGDPEPLRRALQAARAAATTTPDWQVEAPPATRMASLQPGGWFTFRAPRWSPLGAGEITHDGRTPFVYDTAAGRYLALDGSQAIVSRSGEVCAPGPDRAALLVPTTRGQVELRSSEGRTLDAFEMRGRTLLGWDPLWAIAWSGHRMLFYWHVARAGATAVLSAAAHDSPCGHAKKLFGYDDNQPRWIHLAPHADAYLSTFDRDVIVAASVPLHWQIRGDVAVAGPPPADSLRALLFTSSADQRATWQADLPDQDARGPAPVVVLGPNEAVRYAVALEHEVYRLRGERLEQLSPGGGGFAIFDADHRPVRQAPGRLLGGWDGVATVEHQGELFREDLSTGARRRLGASDRPIAHALPIAGTENVVLVAASGDGNSETDAEMRVV